MDEEKNRTHRRMRRNKKAKRAKHRKRRHFSLRRVCGVLSVYVAALAVVALAWLYTMLPEHICVETGDTLHLARFSWISPLMQYGAQNVTSTHVVGSYNTTLALGGVIPIKTVRTVVAERPSVTVCGTPFGVKMFSEGALVVGFSELSLENGGHTNPAKEAGLRLGDRVICINDVQTLNNDAVKEAVEKSNGQAVEVIYVRDGEQYMTWLTPAWDKENKRWMAGMWVRDSSAGVGTLTFVDEAGIFAGLGHAISDSDTGESVALRSGEIVPCEIVGYTAGTAGDPGELKGQFVGSTAIGTICLNGDNGVYGTVRTEFLGKTMEVAFAQEVTEGEAQILTTISGEEPRAYTVSIEHVSDADSLRNLVIRVTDETLLAETGGIVQGMSGSPIVQNGRLVGAVTHVLVNDPTRGYGIFAETMLEQAENVLQLDDAA
jgi:stage IV sporulation protein B